ncbi:MAG: 3-hydroxybutyrate oligomer hydrolase family protein [Burkholderiaceae bacterium]
MRPLPPHPWLAAALCVALAGCADSGDPAAINTLPAGVGTPTVTTYAATGVSTADSAATQDLLTGGLGKSGLMAAAPGFADAAHPTALELRRRAIWTNYRGVLDITAAGGFGTLYGPNVGADGVATASEGLVPGREYIAYDDDGTGRKNVVLMVQVPDSFDKSHPCMVAAPSSGSRGVYGAIGSAGEWGLKHGCAVAYTDAGKGTGYDDLQADLVNTIDGRLVPRTQAASAAQFAAPLSDAERASFDARLPDRIAYKHIYSAQNPEKDWGRDVLDSLRFGFWAINDAVSATDPATGKKLATITPGNTLVIASSISNGGGASLQAAEQDADGLIDGVVVAEPNAQPAGMDGVQVKFAGSVVPVAGRPLIDYFTYRMIYEPCAAIAAQAQAPNGVRPGWIGFGTAPLGSALTQAGGMELQAMAANRCQSLADKGLVHGTTTEAQAESALAKMRAYGWSDPLNDALHASHYRLADMYVAYGYVNAYGRFSVTDDVCGFSLANVDAGGNVAPQVPAVQAALFATSNGLNTGADVIYDASVGGPVLYHRGVSPSTGRADGALDGDLCLRNLVTGVDTVTGSALTGNDLAMSQRVQQGMHDVLLTGKLRGKPTVMVAGRSDTLLPVNHAARAYLAFNAKVDPGSDLHYIEVMYGQHFDAFLPNAANGGVQGYDALLVPVHYYFVQGMDAMWAHLTGGTALPPSQVVRTVPRGGTPGAAPALTTANVPPIAAAPADADRISASAGVATIPQ